MLGSYLQVSEYLQMRLHLTPAGLKEASGDNPDNRLALFGTSHWV